MKIMCWMAAALLVGPAAPGHAVQRDDTFTVGTATAARGQKVYGVIPVPAGSDAGYDIPVALVHGAKPGPVLAVVAGAHGTEYASILAVEQLIDFRGVDPSTMAGTLILVPIVNVNSFDRMTPHVNPTDGKSMNRFYPGTLAGTQTDRAAYAITKEVIDKCDHLIDLHGGDLDENLRPYSYWTVTGNRAQDEFSKQMVLAFGLDHIIIAADRPKDPAASRYLENTASVRGKASFAAEAGRSGPPSAADVTMLVRGVMGVMTFLKMTASGMPAPPVEHPVWVETVTVAAERDGVFWPAVDRDAHVSKGARLGSVTDVLHRPLQDIVAPEDGIVMFVRALPTLHKGDTIASIGVIKDAR
ncbi:MAG TPA: succinylglutamate desuccinylase/aspartoacylase family protein [Vicinamibacterales bacterium]|nr:succinylglutamate desuccinylase/aspartoacylase family protein [Vicinamibacterales bacterium]